MGSQVAQNLRSVHEREVIHRDIKPQNILLTEAVYAKVADIGNRPGYEREHDFLIKPCPGHRRLHVSRASEGVVYYEMLTAELRFSPSFQKRSLRSSAET
ncbi:MAG: protein kinase [Actinobacteria bacterium]|nr:protein kinase [Actinomycetota bacterium]